MAGIPFTAADLNARAGLLVQSVAGALADARQFKLWLDDGPHTDAILTASPYTVPAADLTVIRQAFTDLASLYGVAHGTVTPSGANDYFFNAKKLTGLFNAA